MANLGKIIYLSEAQKDELFAQGTVTSNGTTITYDANDLYITPDKSIDTIQLNNTSYTATNGTVNLGNVLTSTNLNILAPVESSSSASQLYNVNDLFIYNNLLYQTTSTIATNTSITPNTNCTSIQLKDLVLPIVSSSDNGKFLGVSSGAWATTTLPVTDVQINGTSIVSNGVASIPFGGDYTLGLVKARKWATRTNAMGIYVNDTGELGVIPGNESQVKGLATNSCVITPGNTHQAVFWGLAKAAGDVTQIASSNAVGTYTNNAKSAIQQMLGLDGSAFVSSEWEIINEVTTTEDVAQYAVITDSNGQAFDLSAMYVRVIFAAPTTGATGYVGSSSYAKWADGTQSWSYGPTLATLSGTSSSYFEYKYEMMGDTCMIIAKKGNGFGNTQNVESGSIPSVIDMSNPLIAIGGIRLEQYNSNHTLIPAGTIIKIYGKRKRTALDSAIVNVSGTTPSITALAGHRYICGECSTLTITVPAAGCIDVLFKSGSTPTSLTVTSLKTGVTAIKWAGGFDPTNLEANYTYEINILDGEYGVACVWT